RHKTAIDNDDPALGLAQWRQHVKSRAAARTRRIQIELLVIEEDTIGEDGMELERARFREAARRHRRCGGNSRLALRNQFALPIQPLQLPDAKRDADQHHRDRDRKSTRLNSSHRTISYA